MSAVTMQVLCEKMSDLSKFYEDLESLETAHKVRTSIEPHSAGTACRYNMQLERRG